MTEDQTEFVLKALYIALTSSYRSLKKVIFNRKIKLTNNF